MTRPTVAAVLFALVGCLVGGYLIGYSHRPPPKVEYRDRTVTKEKIVEVASARLHQTADVVDHGQRERIVYTYAGCSDKPARVEVVRERGPVETRTVVQTQTQVQREVDVQVKRDVLRVETPAPLRWRLEAGPAWSQVGRPNGVAVGAGVRVVGPLWLGVHGLRVNDETVGAATVGVTW
jgi:hypothetical protein